CTNKFGEPVTAGLVQNGGALYAAEPDDLDSLTEDLTVKISEGDAMGGFEAVTAAIPAMEFDDLREILEDLRTRALAAGPKGVRSLIEITTLLLDRNYPLGGRRRAQLRAILQEELFGFLRSLRGSAGGFAFLGWEDRSRLRAPSSADEILVVDARGFPPEGDEGLDQFVVRAYL